MRYGQQSRRYRSQLVAVGVFTVIGLFPTTPRAQTAPPSVPSDAAFHNASLPPEQRARDLVSRMTLDEKVSQIPNHASAITRLGVPEYDYWSEGLHGVARAGYATVFPQAIGMAATWDESLILREGETIASEARLKYEQAREAKRPAIYFGLDIWSPNINIFRDPRWGRGQETYGEDPFLTSRLSSAFINGLQGTDPAHPNTIATPKHFSVHSGPEALRHGFDVAVSPHDLEDTYLPAFRAAIVDAHAQSIMCAYNRIEGQPACASDVLLKQKLRDAWGFTGYVTSDCGAIDDIFKGHMFVTDRPSASAVSLMAGTDTACGNPAVEVPALLEAIQRDLVTEADVDRAVIRLFTARFRLGMFDPQPAAPMHQQPDHALELAAACESIVLLKNDGILPLANSARTVAVVGPNAASVVALEGNYAGVIVSPSFPADANFSTPAIFRKVIYAQGSSLAENFFVPVPRTVFRTSAGRPGLDVVYTDESPVAAPPLRRVDNQIDFNWNAASPFSGDMMGPAQAFTAHWTGRLVPPVPGDYLFKIQQSQCYPCEDTEHYTVLFDGKPAVDINLPPANRENLAQFKLHFPDTSPRTFELTFSHHARLSGASITLAWLPPAEVMRSEAVEAARHSDVTVAYIGLSSQLEGEEMKVDLPGFGGGDRTTIDLPKAQQDLLDALSSTGKPLVVVLLNGSAIGLKWAREHANAIVEAWYPGGRGGQAIADVLTGAYNPAGRLPVTFYASTADLPPFENYSMAGRTYRYFTGRPLYGFGFGLSYSSFQYTGLHLDSSSLKAGEPLAVHVQVQNTSKLRGDEVVELYLAPPATSVSPRQTLVGFSRINLAAGEKRTVDFVLTPRTISLVDANGLRSVAPGEYRLNASGSQPDESSTQANANFHITGSFPVAP